MFHAIEGKCLDILNLREDQESRNLFGCLETICKVIEPFIDALPNQGGSLPGVNHIRGVLHEIENLIRSSDYLNLSSAEIFVLLASILTHDIGKLEEDNVREGKSRKKFEAYQSGVEEALKLKFTEGQVEKLKMKPHPLISAYELLIHPTKYGFFDKELANLVAIVALSHCDGFKSKDALDCAQKLTEDKYLSRYGKIRIAWLCALLVIGDELDTSYHRALPADLPTGTMGDSEEDFSKGEFRSNIGGCRIDLVGRCIIVHPIGLLKQYISVCKSKKNLFQSLARDVSGKNDVLKAWEAELKQMNINVQACLVEVDGHLFQPVQKDEESPFCFIPSVEPIVKNFKVSRVIEAMFKLKYGIFKKKYFSWEMLQSESGFENQQELKLIVHRISRLARLFSDPKRHEFICPNEAKRKIIAVPFMLDIQVVDMEWTIEARILSTDQSSKKSSSFDYSNISSCFLFFVDSIIKRIDLDTFWELIPEMTKELPGRSDPFWLNVNGDDKEIKYFYVHPGNEQLTYLLDEVTPCPSIAPRGIAFPVMGALDIRRIGKPGLEKSIKFNPRLLGMNLVIAGPPGIGKSTLALDIICNLSLRGCDGKCEKHKDEKSLCHRIIANTGAVAYFSLEQPIFTIKNLAMQLGHPHSNPGSTRAIELDNPQSEFFKDYVYNKNFQFDVQILESQSLGLDSTNGDTEPSGGKEEYMNLFLGKEHCRILLLPRLSPRFVGEQTATNERKLFWQRFKQISRLIEASFSATSGDPFDPMRLHALVIDNINSFLNEPMGREYIFKLFRLISSSGLLGIFILEDPGRVSNGKGKLAEEVQFLSDIWIELWWAEKLDYKMKMLELKKSRYQRHVFGYHPFKIRFKDDL